MAKKILVIVPNERFEKMSVDPKDIKDRLYSIGEIVTGEHMQRVEFDPNDYALDQNLLEDLPKAINESDVLITFRFGRLVDNCRFYDLQRLIFHMCEYAGVRLILVDEEWFFPYEKLRKLDNEVTNRPRVHCY